MSCLLNKGNLFLPCCEQYLAMDRQPRVGSPAGDSPAIQNSAPFRRFKFRPHPLDDQAHFLAHLANGGMIAPFRNISEIRIMCGRR